VRCAVPVRRGYVRHWGPGRGCSLPLTGDRYGLSSSVNHSIWPSLYDEDSIPPSVPSSCSITLFPSVTSSSSSFALPRRVGLSASHWPRLALALDRFSRPSGAGLLCHPFLHLTPSALLPRYMLSILFLTVGPAGYCH
jgi:hypothetical protein